MNERPAWFYPGNGAPRQEAAIKAFHTHHTVDLITSSGDVETMVPFHEVADDPAFRHAYRPDANDNVDVARVMETYASRRRMPGADSDNGNDDGA